MSDLFAPVTGKVVNVNSPLADSPEYVNDDPYDEGWMVEVEMTDPTQTKDLMIAEQYQAFLAESEQ